MHTRAPVRPQAAMRRRTVERFNIKCRRLGEESSVGNDRFSLKGSRIARGDGEKQQGGGMETKGGRQAFYDECDESSVVNPTRVTRHTRHQRVLSRVTLVVSSGPAANRLGKVWYGIAHKLNSNKDKYNKSEHSDLIQLSCCWVTPHAIHPHSRHRLRAGAGQEVQRTPKQLCPWPQHRPQSPCAPSLVRS